jgi:hypothetical protein
MQYCDKGEMVYVRKLSHHQKYGQKNKKIKELRQVD